MALFVTYFTSKIYIFTSEMNEPCGTDIIGISVRILTGANYMILHGTEVHPVAIRASSPKGASGTFQGTKRKIKLTTILYIGYQGKEYMELHFYFTIRLRDVTCN
jgi:hypothetical protein